MSLFTPELDILQDKKVVLPTSLLIIMQKLMLIHTVLCL